MWMGDALGEESVIKDDVIHSNRAREGKITIAGNADGSTHAMWGKLGRWNESSIETWRWAIVSISAVRSAAGRLLLRRRWLWLWLWPPQGNLRGVNVYKGILLQTGSSKLGNFSWIALLFVWPQLAIVTELVVLFRLPQLLSVMSKVIIWTVYTKNYNFFPW